MEKTDTCALCAGSDGPKPVEVKKEPVVKKEPSMKKDGKEETTASERLTCLLSFLEVIVIVAELWKVEFRVFVIKT